MAQGVEGRAFNTVSTNSFEITAADVHSSRGAPVVFCSLQTWEAKYPVRLNTNSFSICRPGLRKTPFHMGHIKCKFPYERVTMNHINFRFHRAEWFSVGNFKGFKQKHGET